MVLRAVDVGRTDRALVLVSFSLLLLGGCLREKAKALTPIDVFVGGARAEEIASTPASPDEREDAVWEVREEVDVDWRGAWFPAIVLERRGIRYLVHYEGHGAEWDEIVGAARIRERRAAAEVDAPSAVEEAADPP